MSAPKKKTSGLTILLAVIGGGFLLIVAVVGIVAWRVMSSPEGKMIVGLVGETMRIMQKAQSAPGTREVRSLGCKTAMVIDLEDFEKLMERFDAGAKRTGQEPFGSMVACGMGPFGTPPACDDIAKTYVGAVGTRPRPFLVSVSKQGHKQALCSVLYEGDGTRLRDADDPGTTNVMPTE